MKEGHIRFAVEEDIDGIVKLLLQLYSSMTDRACLNPDGFRENCREILKDKNSFILVAERRGSLAGFISFTVRKTCMHSGLSATIDELVVAPGERGSGIGMNLIQAAAQKSRELGCCELEVSTEPTNTRAREFYRRCGFDEVGILLEKALD